MGRAWNTPVGRWLYCFSALKNGGPVPVGHALQDRQVQFQDTLTGVEDATKEGTEATGDLFDVDFGHEVHVEFGT